MFLKYEYPTLGNFLKIAIVSAIIFQSPKIVTKLRSFEKKTQI